MKPYRITALLWKYVFTMQRNLDRLFDAFYFPAVGLFTWGFTTIYLRDVTQSSQFIRFFLGGFILWTIVERAQHDLTIALLQDFWNQNIYNTFASPLTNLELFIATTLYAIMRAAAAFLFLMVLAALLYSFNVLSIGVFAVAGFIFSLLLFGAGLGIAVAGLIYRYGQRIQVFAWSTAPILQPFSLVFYPRSALPEPFYTVSLGVPTSYIFKGMRTALEQGVIPWRLLGIGFASSLATLGLGYLVFHHFIEQARQHGYLTEHA